MFPKYQSEKVFPAISHIKTNLDNKFKCEDTNKAGLVS